MDSETSSITMESDGEQLENRVIQPTAYDYTRVIDLSGVPICGLCDNLVEENQSKTVLACKHIFHIGCVLATYWEEGIHRCNLCNGSYFTEEEYGYRGAHTVRVFENAIRQKKREESKKKLEKLTVEVTSNKDLLKDLKIVKKAIRESSAASKKFRSLGRRYSREFSEEVNTMKQIILARKKEYKTKLMRSAEMIDFKRKRSRASYFMRVFDQKYRAYPFETLQKIPGLKIPNRWSIRRAISLYSWTINRWFRIGV
jgi:hypothetical protein